MPADDPADVPVSPAVPGQAARSTRLVETLRVALSRELVRAGVLTYVFSALALGANLVTGIVTARALGPSGRGTAVALVTVTQLIGFFFAMGVAQSLSYFLAQHPKDGPRLFTSWLLILLPLSVLAIVVGELLLTTIFSTHNAQGVSIGRWFLLTVVLVIGLELNSGLLLGAQDFAIYNVLRFAQPALTAATYVVMWQLDSLTVTSALIAASIASGIVLAVGMARSIERVGIGRADLRLGLRGLWFGIRGHGVMVATSVNSRLDVAMLPAFVAASSVGLYSVATNLSLIVYQLSNTFAGLVLPAAARDPDRGRVKVVGSLFATVAVVGALALVLAVFARPLLGAVYGDQFRDAAPLLEILLPGAVCFAASSILSAGVYAAGSPFTATLTQLIGMAVTVIGLLVFLRTGGTTAAAVVSTTAYATVFGATLVAYKVVADVPWRYFVPTPARLRAFVAG